MDREDHNDEIVELGVASVETKGIPGGTGELSALGHNVGISDE